MDGKVSQPETKSKHTKVLKSDERPFDYTPVSLTDLPETPTRDRNIAASAWDQAPNILKTLGESLDGKPEAVFKRRIHGWLLWRAGPTLGPCRYLALDPSDHDRFYIFDLDGNKNDSGQGPDRLRHTRFRSWKESLRDNPIPNVPETN
ncbi:MAG: hypothetical protein GWP30_00345 [Actinobacteria bacterium]|nr:hypothetical protein [Actinomycetota bacterium]MDG2119762.1 hypothetical protein [Actinomycetota bacterium]NCG39420.1 hypothetical protein [Actinomycetota bacterium]